MCLASQPDFSSLQSFRTARLHLRRDDRAHFEPVPRRSLRDADVRGRVLVVRSSAAPRRRHRKIKGVAQRLVAAREAGTASSRPPRLGATTDDLIALRPSISAPPHPREYDRLVRSRANFERACAMADPRPRPRAVSLTGSQAAFPPTPRTAIRRSSRCARPSARRRPRPHRPRAGFPGVSTELAVRPLGRAGSDATAVALDGALGGLVRDLHRRRRRSSRPTRASSRMPEAATITTRRCSRWRRRRARDEARSCRDRAPGRCSLHVRAAFGASEGTWIGKEEDSCREGDLSVSPMTSPRRSDWLSVPDHRWSPLGSSGHSQTRREHRHAVVQERLAGDTPI